MPAPPDAAAPLDGLVHMYVAFDWGDAIDLAQARRLVPASIHELPRRPRTPSSFSYRVPPLYIALGPVPLELPELGRIEAQAGLTAFDFGGVSVGLRLPFSLSPGALMRVAGSLANPVATVQAARTLLQPLYQALRPAIEDPSWQEDFSEEYFVFQLPDAVRMAEQLSWLAGMVRLECGPLSSQETQEALRLKLSYSPDDLLVPDWAAAVLIDKDCEETLHALELANLQLLEFRHIDQRLDNSLAAAQRTIGPLTRSLLPFWRMHSRPLRVLGELKVEANDLFERTENVLKLIGDPYLARVYRLVAQRFHLDTWEDNIQRKLEVAEGVYQVVADQASRTRTEFLEIIVVLLILIEIVLAFVRH